jgi:hypothetical protein
MLIVGKSKTGLHALKNQLKLFFFIKDLENANHILDMRINTNKKDIIVFVTTKVHLKSALQI